MHIIQFDEIESTQLTAKKIAKDESDLTIIVAKNQTAGMGRYDRKWVSGIGGLWATWILKKEISTDKLPYLALFVGFHLYKMFHKTNVPVQIKYPNDILFGGKKLAGILCNSSIQGNKHLFSLVGIGLNISNCPPPEGISLEDISKAEYEISFFIKRITDAIIDARNSLIESNPQDIFTKLKEIDCINLPLDNNLNSL